MKRKTKRVITVETWTQTVVRPAASGEGFYCSGCGAELTSATVVRDMCDGEGQVLCLAKDCTVSEESREK
jgi:hypothetical protein